MSRPVSAIIPVVFENGNSKLDDSSRASADYHPSIWGDHFLRVPYQSKLSDGLIEREHKILKQEVRRMLITDEPSGEKLALIDAVQRLGVGYHFTSEIEDELQKLFVQDLGDEDDDLCIVALRFRLLRQQGIVLLVMNLKSSETAN